MTLILIGLIVLALVLLGSWYAYSICFHSPKHKRPQVDTPLIGDQYVAVAGDISRISGIMQRYPYEEVTITAWDGMILYGRYYHRKDGAPVEILFHGYRSHPYRDCSGGHALSRKIEYNALVVDQRAHGASGSKTISFGIKERLDCLDWVHYTTDRFGSDTKIILSGLSMGAATVLMASNLDLPKNVVCIIADSPYSSPVAIIEKVCRDRHYPVTLCRPFMYLGAAFFGGFRLGECTAKEAVEEAKVPILLIHGEADHFVPCDMSQEIAEHCVSRVEIATFPDAGHGLCYMANPIRYEKEVCSFLMSIPALANTIPADYVQKLFDNP